MDEKDDEERELEKLEKGDPEMIKICNIIMTQLEEFKVSSVAIKLWQIHFLNFIKISNLIAF